MQDARIGENIAEIRSNTIKGTQPFNQALKGVLDPVTRKDKAKGGASDDKPLTDLL